MPKTAIKGQSVADFIVEFTYPNKTLRVTINASSTSEGRVKDDEPTDLDNVRSLRTDGSSNMNESGVGIVLESPTREKVNYALRLEFPTSTMKLSMRPY